MQTFGIQAIDLICERGQHRKVNVGYGRELNRTRYHAM